MRVKATEDGWCLYCNKAIVPGEWIVTYPKKVPEHSACRNRRLNVGKRSRWNAKNPRVNGHYR